MTIERDALQSIDADLAKLRSQIAAVLAAPATGGGGTTTPPPPATTTPVAGTIVHEVFPAQPGGASVLLTSQLGVIHSWPLPSKPHGQISIVEAANGQRFPVELSISERPGDFDSCNLDAQKYKTPRGQLVVVCGVKGDTEDCGIKWNLPGAGDGCAVPPAAKRYLNYRVRGGTAGVDMTCRIQQTL